MSDAAPVPFEGYDDLSAKDVVERMKDMSADEVAAVKAYERERPEPRKTIVNFGPKPTVRAPRGRPPLVQVAEEAAADSPSPDGDEPVEAKTDREEKTR